MGAWQEAEEILARFEAEAGSTANPSRILAGNRRTDGQLLGNLEQTLSLRTLMLIVFNLVQTVGFYGFDNWVPTFLIHQGIAVTTSLGYTFAIAIAAPFGPLLALPFTDRFERKWLIVGGAFFVGVFGLFFAQMRTAVPLILFGAGLTLANNVMSFSFHAYQAELYPTRIRALAVGFVYSWSRLSAVFGAFVIAFFLDRFRVIGVFSLIAACMLVVMLSIGIIRSAHEQEAAGKYLELIFPFPVGPVRGKSAHVIVVSSRAVSRSSLAISPQKSSPPALEGGSKFLRSDSEKRISGRGAAAQHPAPKFSFRFAQDIFRPALKGRVDNDQLAIFPGPAEGEEAKKLQTSVAHFS